jgi:mannose-6-phosphate isomerase-like protein (cupin superfamily)
MPAEPIFTLKELVDSSGGASAAYREVLRRSSLSAGVYVVPAHGADPQSPHSEDELYVVLRGRARFRCGAATSLVTPGDVLFVAAHEPHRFEEVADDLVLAVFFAPPEGSLAPGGTPGKPP